MEIDSTMEKNSSTCLLYGHCDKQPPMEGWTIGSPYKALIKDNKLYGRGGADDGYAIFTIISSIKYLQLNKIPHARYVAIIEACEESGSPDLLYYVKKIRKKKLEIQILLFVWILDVLIMNNYGLLLL